MKCRGLAWTLALAMASSAASLSASEPPPLVVKPASVWNLNYGDDSCRMARVFVNGSDKLIFLIDQFGIGPALNITVAGKPLRSVNSNKVRAAFGPSGGTVSFDNPFEATFGSYGPAVLINGIALIDAPPLDTAASGPTEVSPTVASVLNAEPGAERAIRWFEVQLGKRAPVRFELGPMEKPMTALRGCAEELVSHWGIDVAAHKSLTREVTPRTNPGTWVSSSDYPTDMLARGMEGTIHFRLSIAEDGSVTGCHIQQSTRPAEFDTSVCRILIKRARFEPALDAKGNPIKSYWRSQFRFVIP